MELKHALPLISLLLVVLNSCAPVFSELQSARTVGKGNIEATGAFSTVSFTNEGESEHAQNNIGIQAGYGLSDVVDLRVRYEYLWLDKSADAGGVNILGFGPKFSLLKDRIAGYVPLGFAFGKDVETPSDTWQIHPTLLGTTPAGDFFEINPSFKVLLPFKKELETTVAFNLGLGFNVNDKVTIRPEYGMLFNPGETGHYGQFSIGLTINPQGRP